ncbi:MAG: hypothetical protein M5U12_09660 [Verrucomicrobia bacterium]|nr:hypothetical protein [Verrucomicrobiota bacterium]
MFTKSIRWRLQLWQAFLLMLVLSGFGFTAYQLHRLNRFRQIDEELERRVAALADELRGRPPFGQPPGRGPFDLGPGGPPAWEVPTSQASIRRPNPDSSSAT